MEIILNLDEKFYTKEDLAEFTEPRLERCGRCWYFSDNRDADYQISFCTYHNCKVEPTEYCSKAVGKREVM